MEHADCSADVYCIMTRRARKEHRCAACLEAIPAGHTYTLTSIVADRTAWSVKRCARCEAIHAHLRDSRGYDEWPADALDCGESYLDVFGKEPPAEIAALAFALPGEVPLDSGLGPR